MERWVHGERHRHRTHQIHICVSWAVHNIILNTDFYDFSWTSKEIRFSFDDIIDDIMWILIALSILKLTLNTVPFVGSHDRTPRDDGTHTQTLTTHGPPNENIIFGCVALYLARSLSLDLFACVCVGLVNQEMTIRKETIKRYSIKVLLLIDFSIVSLTKKESNG